MIELLAQGDPVTGSAAWGGVMLFAIKMLADARRKPNGGLPPGAATMCIEHAMTLAKITEAVRHTEAALTEINRKLDAALSKAGGL